MSEIVASPIPGDPDQVRSMAQQYLGVADAIRGAASKLRNVDSNGSSSDAVDAFVKKAGDLASKLMKAHGRYEGTGNALMQYQSSLRSAIDEAEAASKNHASSSSDASDATRLQQHYQQLADSATDPTQQQDYQQLADAKGQDATSSQADASRAAAAVQRAESDRDSAANTAISAIDDSIDDSLKDGWWDNFVGWMKANDGWIDVALKIVQIAGTILAVAALFFPLTAPFAIAAIVLMGVALVGDSARAAAGTGSWFDVGMDALSLATFGAGGLTAITKLSVVGRLGRGAEGTAKTIMEGRALGVAGRDGITLPRALGNVKRSLGSIGQTGNGSLKTLKVTWSTITKESRLAAIGDVDRARLMQWMSRARLGSEFDDPAQVAKLASQLRTGAVLEGIGTTKDGIESIENIVSIATRKDITDPLTKFLQDHTTARIP